MKLEAVDPRHPSCICVVSVVETQGARMRLHFDGWSESYDFWTNSDSHLLFPAGFCSKYGQKLNLPRGLQSISSGKLLKNYLTACFSYKKFEIVTKHLILNLIFISQFLVTPRKLYFNL